LYPHITEALACAAPVPPQTELAELLDRVLYEEALRFVVEVPRAGQLTDNNVRVDLTYYLRHRIETVRRIRATARTDALALVSMVEEDYEAAREWSTYATTELSHDRMFLADLERHGISAEQALGTPPLLATTALLEWLSDRIARHGSLPAVAYSVFVEWNSARYSARAVERAAASFGEDTVRGARAHLLIDVDEDHYTMMVRIAHRLLQRHGSSDLLVEFVRDIAAHFRSYFVELHYATSSPDIAQR
jgi:hypothetical protein